MYIFLSNNYFFYILWVLSLQPEHKKLNTTQRLMKHSVYVILLIDIVQHNNYIQ